MCKQQWLKSISFEQEEQHPKFCSMFFWVVQCILESVEILSEEKTISKQVGVGVVGILVSRRETTNPKSTLFVTFVLGFGWVLLCWVLVWMCIWTTSKEFKVFEALVATFNHLFFLWKSSNLLLTANGRLLEFST